MTSTMTSSIREIYAKSVLTKTRLPGANYVINPYVGCHVGCTYCYAAFMRRFTNHPEPWGKFVDVKINAPSVLEREIQKAKKGIVLLSSVTDPYQPLEKKYELTRKILHCLCKHQWPVSILTKRNLVLRDIDVLKQFETCEVGFSISSLCDKDRIIFEPASSTVHEKIEALKVLHKQQIETYAFIGPVLPGITNVSEIISKIRDYVSEVWVEAMNFKAAHQTGFFYERLRARRPDLVASYKAIEKDGRAYFDGLKREVEKLRKEEKIEITLVMHENN
ncbi:radical SAM protein [Candidatus Woesearchaeota archaeon]|nr:radical SAM protein [Candidatus Woesearchaeota archaeon]